MKKILDELDRVEFLFNSLEKDEDHRNSIYKEDREWWVLGRVKKIFDGEHIPFPDYAKKLPEDDTDFIISFDGKRKYKMIQIVEVPPLENLTKSKPKSKIDIWKSYEKIILKKLKANFGKDNWLVVYFDVRYSQITSSGTWHNTIIQRSLKIKLSEHNYEKIIVMDPRGKAAISIFPYLFIICPEWISKSTIIDKMHILKKNYYATTPQSL